MKNTDTQASGVLRLNRARAIEAAGDQHHDVAQIQNALNEFKDASRLLDPQKSPVSVALAQAGIGRTLLKLNGLTGSSDELRRAIVALRDASSAVVEKASADWLLVQTELADALEKLGNAQGDVASIEEGCTVLQQAYPHALVLNNRTWINNIQLYRQNCRELSRNIDAKNRMAKQIPE